MTPSLPALRFLLLGSALAAASLPAAAEMVFEAEEWSTPTNAWLVDRTSEDAWNLWSQDVDAAKKWSGGKTLQSPIVKADRKDGDVGTPVLHVVLTGIPKGFYDVKIKHARSLGVSRDEGRTWVDILPLGGDVGSFQIDEGRFELWVDARFATKGGIGRSYFDAVILTPSRPKPKALTELDGRFEKGLDEWEAWFQNEGGTADLAAETREGAPVVSLHAEQPLLSYSLNSKARLPAGPGEIWEVSAWVRVKGVGGVNVGLVAFTGRNQISSDVIAFGERASMNSPAWKRISGRGTVPPGADSVAPRVFGNGKALVEVSGVEARKIVGPIVAAVERPFPAGWAKERVVEKLGRGLVAMVTRTNTVHLSWRLRTADGDATFDVLRKTGDGRWERINPAPLARTTDLLDANPDLQQELRYRVRTSRGDREIETSPDFVIPANSPANGFLSFPIQGGSFGKAGIGDLDGDGEWDYVIKTPMPNVVDPFEPFWRKSPDTYKLEAYAKDGRPLWKRDLGWSVEMGIWYSPYLAWDLDGDGKAEVMVKVGDPEVDPRDPDGRVLQGEEWCLILDGATGKERGRIPWPTRDGFSTYNFASRNQMGVAYLDGKTPSLILARGTYTTMKAEAWEFHGGAPRNLWKWSDQMEGTNQKRYYGQGAHTMVCADLDGDGKDEVLLGSCAIAPNGTGLWSTGMGHCDAAYVGKIDPSLPGLQIYYNYETPQKSNGMCLVDARTGNILWGIQEPTRHIHNMALCADIDPFYPGMECYGGEKDFPLRRLHSAKGQLVADEKTFDVGLFRPTVYWDGDLQREIKVGSAIRKLDGSIVNQEPIAGGDDFYVVIADVIGDWREEIITHSEKEMRIYVSTVAAEDRRPTLMEDPLYRRDVAHKSMGYPGSPMTSTFLGKSSDGATLVLPDSAFRNASVYDAQLRFVSVSPTATKATVHLSTNEYLGLERTEFDVDVVPGRISTVSFPVSLKKRPAFLSGTRQGVLGARISIGDTNVFTRKAIDIEEEVPESLSGLIQADRFTTQSGGEIKVRTPSEKPGTTGPSISHWDKEGHRLVYRIRVDEPGDYALYFRYAAASDAVREISVDGKRKVHTFLSSGGLGNFPQEWVFRPLAEGSPILFPLTAGEHEVQLLNTDGVGLNLNYLALLRKKP